MKTTDSYDKYDLSKIIVKPLYFGLVVNVVAPVALLLVCYYLTNHGTFENRLGDFANTLFYIFWVFAIVQAGIAIWWLRKKLRQPMIREEKSFHDDFIEGLIHRSRPVFLLIASISIWGYVYFLLTGRFNETVSFVVFSFIVFQVVRPRYGSVEKNLKHQKELVEQGKFLQN